MMTHTNRNWNAGGRSNGTISKFFGAVAKIFQHINCHGHNARTRREMELQSDRFLRDIGLNRRAVWSAAWQNCAN